MTVGLLTAAASSKVLGSRGLPTCWDESLPINIAWSLRSTEHWLRPRTDATSVPRSRACTFRAPTMIVSGGNVGERIWLSAPDVGPRERELLLDAFDSNWIAPLGPHVNALEDELAAVTGRQHCAALASGTAALHLGLKAMGVGRGQVVVTASQTFAATANAVVHCGATPWFVDSEPDRWSMDPALLNEALTTAAAEGHEVGAVVPVDLYGQCADHAAIAEVAAKHGVPVFTDAAESLGAAEHGAPAGSHGVAAVVSFNGNKIITGSGGGALVTDDEELAERVTFLATQAREPARHYEHTVVGHNERMSNLIAAVIRGALEHLPKKVERRRAIHQRYRDAFADLDGLRFPTTPVSYTHLTLPTKRIV